MASEELWANDQLSRRAFADHVIRLLISRYEARETFIANLDAAWGQGKTYFLENLGAQLKSVGFSVAYVNA